MSPPPSTPVQTGQDLGIPLWRVLDHDLLAEWGSDFPNQPLLRYACDGIQFGLDDTAMDFPDLPSRMLPNSATHLADPAAMQKEIDKESEADRFWFMCPAEELPLCDRARTWPMGLTPKKSHSTERSWRTTTNLSKAWKGEPSLSECMPDLEVQFINPLDCAAAVAAFGPGASFNKYDLTAAYRHCGMRPDQFYRHMIQWEGAVFVDRCLCFGGKNGPFQFTAIMSVVAFIVQKFMNSHFGEGNVIVLFLLDDLATVCRTVAMAEEAFEMVKTIYKKLGFNLNEGKSARAAVIDEWLGLEFDIPRLLIRLPKDKFDWYLADVRRTIRGRTSSLKQLETLGGRLNYACHVWPMMRAYLHELWRLKAKLGAFPTRTHHHTLRLREDMHACEWFFQHGPERPIRHYPTQNTEIDHPVSPGADMPAVVGDASGTMGFGFFSSSGHYAHQGWDLSTRFPHTDVDVSKLSLEDNSTYVETYCMVSAVLTEIDQGFKGTTLAYYTDSRNATLNWAKRRSPTRAINDLLRCLIPALLRNGLNLEVRWRNREDKWQKVADALSRNTCPSTLQALWDCSPQTTTMVTPTLIHPGMAALRVA